MRQIIKLAFLGHRDLGHTQDDMTHAEAGRLGGLKKKGSGKKIWRDSYGKEILGTISAKKKRELKKDEAIRYKKWKETRG